MGQGMISLLKYVSPKASNSLSNFISWKCCVKSMSPIINMLHYRDYLDCIVFLLPLAMANDCHSLQQNENADIYTDE